MSDGLPRTFPRTIDNPAALRTIRTRLGSYSEIRRFLLSRLDRQPELAGWTYRGADDPGVALLEAAALVGDGLTFYQDLYQNEAYLRTAKWRESIAALVQLYAYRLATGLGGCAEVALSARGDHPVAVAAGQPFNVQLDGLDGPADFVTTEAIVAHPKLSQFHLYRPLGDAPDAYDAQSFRVRAGAAGEIKANDRLIVADESAGSLSHWRVVVVEEVNEVFGKTVIKLRSPLERHVSQNPVAYRIGDSYRHFGHDAAAFFSRLEQPPEEESEPAMKSYKVAYDRSTSDSTPRDAATGDPDPTSFAPPLAAADLALASDARDLSEGDFVLIDASLAAFEIGPFRMLIARKVEGIRTPSIAFGAATGPATIIRTSGFNFTNFAFDIRGVTVHRVLGERLELAPREEETTEERGQTLLFDGGREHADVLVDRRVLIVNAAGEHTPTKVSRVLGESRWRGLHEVELADEVDYADFAWDGPATVHGNVVAAKQGKGEPEAVLGNGDAAAAFQTFRLPGNKLTYHLVAENTPPATPTLELIVDGRPWTRVASLYDAAPDAEVYIVRHDDEGQAYVQGGDGKTGARFPTGQRNIRARLSTGIGAHGAQKAGTSVQLTRRIEGLDRALLAGEATGGEPPEQAEKARQAAPGTIQSLDRLVSLADVEYETLAIPGVVGAAARWALAGGVPGIRVTVLMRSGREGEVDEVRRVLQRSLRCRGADRDVLSVHLGHLAPIFVKAEVGLEPRVDKAAVFAAIHAALGLDDESGATALLAGPERTPLFALAARRFGEPENAARVAGVIQAVAGVAFVRLVGFGALAAAGAAPPHTVVDRVDCAPDAILWLGRPNGGEHPVVLSEALVVSSEPC